MTPYAYVNHTNWTSWVIKKRHKVVGAVERELEEGNEGREM